MASLIHETAIISPKAQLGKNIQIGPYSIIGDQVSIGDNSSIGSHVVITGNTSIGGNNNIYSHNSIGAAPQDKKYKDEDTKLVIGDNNTIREFCTINLGTSQDKGITRIGNNNWIMAYVHIAHDCDIGNEVIMANNSSLAGHVQVDDYAILGGFTLVHQFCKIGAHIISAVNTVIFKDVPPYLMISEYGGKPSGINMEGLKRRGFESKKIDLIKKSYRIIFRDQNTTDEAIQKLRELDKSSSEVKNFISFLENSQRGIVR
jgi:UDP-N-acetylglucosamine acyltransferase